MGIFMDFPPIFSQVIRNLSTFGVQTPKHDSSVVVVFSGLSKSKNPKLAGLPSRTAYSDGEPHHPKLPGLGVWDIFDVPFFEEMKEVPKIVDSEITETIFFVRSLQVDSSESLCGF